MSLKARAATEVPGAVEGGGHCGALGISAGQRMDCRGRAWHQGDQRKGYCSRPEEREYGPELAGDHMSREKR